MMDGVAARGLRLIGAALLLMAGATAHAQVVVEVVADDFVLPSRAARLDALAQADAATAQVRFRHVAVGPKQALPEHWPAEAALVVLDTPRPADKAAVEKAVGARLSDARVPWIRVGGGAPAWGHLDDAQARRLIGYYGNGGPQNARHLARWLAVHAAGGDPMAEVPPPQRQPATGYYLSGPAGWIESPEDLRARWQAQGQADWPKAAVIVSAGSIGAMQTEVLDALIEAGRRHRVAVFGLWFEQSEDEGLGRALRGLDVDAVVNMTHLQNGRARSAEFAALDVPAVQTLGWRQGNADAWRASPSGVPSPLLATFVAVPEGWGMSDPMVISATDKGSEQPIPEQVQALAAKLARLGALRHMQAADKHLALLFWNAPDGEKNLSASGLNVPASLAALSRAMAAAGYDVKPVDEQAFIADAQAMLGGYYHPQTLQELRTRGLATAFPVARYRHWLDGLPPAQRDALLARWGDPERQVGVSIVDGQPAYLFPTLRLGKLLVMPQPPRASRIGEATHDMASLPSHYYLAAYLFLREGFAADALIHFGTHGTQEWTPGKDRGLWTGDYPYLTVGDLPVFYPYIQDNIGEATQAKRRGRAVTISHQTPPLAPSGLYDELRDLHASIHEYLQLDDGHVRQATAARIRALAVKDGMAADLGWDQARMQADFDGFMSVLHDHLHELARTATPLGLHTFGEPAAPGHRLSTVMQQLGDPYYRALGLDPQEVFAGDYRQLQASAPYRLLARHLLEGAPLDDIADPQLRALVERGRTHYDALTDTQEIQALLHGLAGGFVLPGSGGDPVRNPDVRSGRNLYLFEPDKLPTRSAFDTGRIALDQLLAAYRADHGGQWPTKLAFSLWSSEAIRHLGVLESEVLHALGLQPVWDAGGRVSALEIVPDAQLPHPRIDAVVQVTSVYRDQFEPFMRLLADAIDRIAALPPQAGNPVAMHARATEQALIARGIAPERAHALATLRIFSNAPSEYGSGFNHAVLDRRAGATKDDAALADGFLSRMQYAYGARETGIKGEGVNLLAEQLHGVQAAVLARSSNVHGLLSSDHPFEYLGGLGLAVRHLDGASPPLYVADLRQAQPRTVSAARFLADELRTRALNPQWIGAMQAEGYAGTLQVLKTVGNLFGWQVADPGSVRADQWQALHDTYVRDTRRLGMAQWFERGNPQAQQQLIERMREAISRGYWQPDAQTRHELDARLRQLQALSPTAPSTARTARARPAGYGRSAASAPAAQVPADAASAAKPASPPMAAPQPAQVRVRGQVMQKRAPAPAPSMRPLWLAVAVLLACIGFGAWRQHRARLSPSP